MGLEYLRTAIGHRFDDLHRSDFLNTISGIENLLGAIRLYLYYLGGSNVAYPVGMLIYMKGIGSIRGRSDRLGREWGTDAILGWEGMKGLCPEREAARNCENC